MNKMEVKFVSHACLRYETSEVVLITDPWITDDPIYCDSIYKFPRQKITMDDAINDVNWVFISHTHEDHFHPESLKLFNKKIPIIIPKFEWCKHTRRNLLKDSLISMGFKNIFFYSNPTRT